MSNNMWGKKTATKASRLNNSSVWMLIMGKVGMGDMGKSYEEMELRANGDV